MTSIREFYTDARCAGWTRASANVAPEMPSLLTNDYVARALNIIEDRISPHIDTATSPLLTAHYKKIA
jgi:hypothetical protein